MHIAFQGLLADDQEFVSADPVNRLMGFGGTLETKRQGGQRVIPGGMAAGVIDPLEAVHIHGDEGGDTVCLGFHIGIAGLAVEKPGQGILFGQVQDREQIIGKQGDGDGFAENM